MGKRQRITRGALFALLTFIVVFQLTASSCRRDPGVASELILFSTEGNTPFSDYVWTIHSDGFNPKPLLSPSGYKSYVAASGNILNKGIVVSVHRSETGEVMEDKLFLFWPNEDKWRPLVTEDLMEGTGVLAPDNAQVAFVAAPRSDPGNYRIWITDIYSGVTRRLSEDEEGTWDGSPTWNPESNEVSFLRISRTPDGLITKLMVARPNSTAAAAVLLEIEQGVLSFCYAPDGKRMALWTRRGLEMMNIRERSRQIILPSEPLIPTYQLEFDNLGCSATQDKLVYALTNTQMKQGELWTIGSDGSNPKKIYSSPNTTVRHPIFLRK